VTSDQQLFARVAVPVPLGQAFSYSVPKALEAQVTRGARVLCDFGRRRVLGVVLDTETTAPDIALERIKPLLGVVGTEPPLPEELLAFLLELARYYVAPIGEVLRLALPAVTRKDASDLSSEGLFERVKVDVVGRMVKYARAVARGTKAKGQALEILTYLSEAGEKPVSELEARWKNARSALKRLAQEGSVELFDKERPHEPGFEREIERDTPPALNPAQTASVQRLCASLDAEKGSAFLLDGVTASGKTEVYLHAVAHCLAQGRSAIVLVPEIALTPQLVGRFRARLGSGIAVLHSGLSSGERSQMWRALRSGKLRVAVGARSALFAPIERLGLICVDEEHDSSFKQDEGVRYHARDMALLRAHRAGAVCVLGSATPSLASEALARQNRLERLRLPNRARGEAVLPAVNVVDLRRIGAGPSGERLLTLPLHRALENVLERGEQAILFLNRRGFAPSLICDECGEIARCPNCAVALTVHQRGGGRLVCHYCDYHAEIGERCAKCGSNALCQEGAGTERIETSLAKSFPKARIARLDRDVAPGIKSERVLDRMRSGEVDILIGTQMVTKGHDLPKVTLVGVLNADAALSLPDFRAAERAFQLLVQVAGRAGRADKPGLVIVQTRRPEHPAILFAAQHDSEPFILAELSDREELGYPPFSRMALIRTDAVDETHARNAAERLARIAKRAGEAALLVVGPAPAPLARLRNRYRFQLVLRSKDRSVLRRGLVAVARTEVDSRVRVTLDVDPMNML
jgi:primosomal protein N' (replication factor Y) (superfamily II helicase)